MSRVSTLLAPQDILPDPLPGIEPMEQVRAAGASPRVLEALAVSSSLVLPRGSTSIDVPVVLCTFCGVACSGFCSGRTW